MSTENNILFEMNIEKWIGLISGWRKRILMLTDSSIKIVKSKTDLKRKNNITEFKLIDCKIVDYDNDQEFMIQYKKGLIKLLLRVQKRKDKLTFFNKLNEAKLNNANKEVNPKILEYFNHQDNNENLENQLIGFNKKQIHDFSDILDQIYMGILKLKLLEKNIKKESRQEFKTIEDSIISFIFKIKKEIQLIIVKEIGIEEEDEEEEKFPEIENNSPTKNKNLNFNNEHEFQINRSLTHNCYGILNNTKKIKDNNDINKEIEYELFNANLDDNCIISTSNKALNLINKDINNDTNNNINNNINNNSNITKTQDNNNINISNNNNINLIDQEKELNKYNTVILNRNNNLNINNEEDDDNEIVNNDEESDLEEIRSVKQLITEGEEKIEKFSKNLSIDVSDFYDVNYNYPPRTSIPLTLQCPDSFISDSLKMITSKKPVFPIRYNEPISMLQKQCEKFFYIDLLYEAAKESIKSELKICYIAAFFCGEMSQNINRYLKPFNPILGETYEFFNNEKRYRFFAEQVSHNPPISAYLCENNDFVLFADTRLKQDFKLFKGAMEIKYTNKTHILFKKNNIEYTISKPKNMIMGCMSKPQYNYEGKLIIEDVNDKSIKGEIEFFLEKKKKKKKNKELNNIDDDNVDIFLEGYVTKNNEKIYKIQGDWHNKIFYYDINNDNLKKEIWEICKEPYLNNTMENCVMPDFTLSLNYINDELKKILPITDSRLRPDQREYENNNVDTAIQYKLILEENQRRRHKKFDKEKITYEPAYFNNVYNDKSSEFIYIYKGDYFKDRLNHSYKNEDVNIFDLVEKTKTE